MRNNVSSNRAKLGNANVLVLGKIPCIFNKMSLPCVNCMTDVANDQSHPTTLMVVGFTLKSSSAQVR